MSENQAIPTEAVDEDDDPCCEECWAWRTGEEPSQAIPAIPCPVCGLDIAAQSYSEYRTHVTSCTP